jgi:hypothetical protein
VKESGLLFGNNWSASRPDACENLLLTCRRVKAGVESKSRKFFFLFL